jgi:hypothetical protein
VSDLEGRADGRQHRRVSSPATVSTGTPSLLRKVRASAASRFPIQFETDRADDVKVTSITISITTARADGRQHRRVSSPATVSTGTPSLLRKVRASAASRFPIQFETDRVDDVKVTSITISITTAITTTSITTTSITTSTFITTATIAFCFALPLLMLLLLLCFAFAFAFAFVFALLLGIRFQIQISDSRFQNQISDSDFRFRIQIQIPDSDSSFRFQIQISDSTFGF